MGYALSGGVWAGLRQTSVGLVGSVVAMVLSASAWANGDVEKNIANEKNWAMQTCVAEHVEQGTSLIDMDKACAQPAFAHWAQYDSQHPRNVVRQYLQTEREFLNAPESSHP